MEHHTFTRTDHAPPPSLQEALEFARRAHAGQHRRQNGRPFIEHPVAVVDLLAEREQSDEVLAAGYLHDTVEKCESVSLSDLQARFGPAVAVIVDALTEEPGIEGYDERKRALRDRALSSGQEAAVVYAADRLANMRDWQALKDAERPKAAARLGTTFESRLQLWDEDLLALTAHDEQLPFLAEIEIALSDLRST